STLHPFTPEAHGRRYGGPRDGLAASPKLDVERRSAPWTLQPGKGGAKLATLSVRKAEGGSPPMDIRASNQPPRRPSQPPPFPVPVEGSIAAVARLQVWPTWRNTAPWRSCPVTKKRPA